MKDESKKLKHININEEEKLKPDYVEEYPNFNKRLHFKSVSKGRKYYSMAIRNYNKYSKNDNNILDTKEINKNKLIPNTQIEVKIKRNELELKKIGKLKRSHSQSRSIKTRSMTRKFENYQKDNNNG